MPTAEEKRKTQTTGKSHQIALRVAFLCDFVAVVSLILSNLCKCRLHFMRIVHRIRSKINLRLHYAFAVGMKFIYFFAFSVFFADCVCKCIIMICVCVCMLCSCALCSTQTKKNIQLNKIIIIHSLQFDGIVLFFIPFARHRIFFFRLTVAVHCSARRAHRITTITGKKEKPQTTYTTNEWRVLCARMTTREQRGEHTNQLTATREETNIGVIQSRVHVVGQHLASSAMCLKSLCVASLFIICCRGSVHAA